MRFGEATLQRGDEAVRVGTKENTVSRQGRIVRMKEDEVPIYRKTHSAGVKTALLVDRSRLAEQIEDMGTDGHRAEPPVPAEDIAQGDGLAAIFFPRQHAAMAFRRHRDEGIPGLLKPAPKLQQGGIRILHS